MIGFELCEELGLKVFTDGQWTIPIIKASDVENLLAKSPRFTKNYNKMSSGEQFDTIVLTVPNKSKPVAKSEIEMLVYEVKKKFEEGSWQYDLVKRLQEKGIE